MESLVRITAPLTEKVVESLRVGQQVTIDGIIYMARDAAHQRLVALIERGGRLPFDLTGQIIFYVGPQPPRPGMVIGPSGPTSSYRMDPYAPTLMAKGLKGMIGKGQRGNNVIEAMKKYKAVYFAAIGGVGALLCKKIVEADVIAYEDLGTEAIRRLVVKDFPVIVVNDIYGNDLYRQGREQYRRTM